VTGLRRALVVDEAPSARGRTVALLQLAGWVVHEATGPDVAMATAARWDFDLVVTAVTMKGGYGPMLLRRLRRNGCRARFLVVTSRPTARVRAESLAAGAVACLAKPLDPRKLADVLGGRTTGPAAPRLAVDRRALQPHPVASRHGAGAVADTPEQLQSGVETAVLERLQEMYVSALPHRLSTIASGAQEGDAEAVASAAQVLAEASAQLGHVDLATASAVLAGEARRGVVAHHRLMRLVELASRVDRLMQQCQTAPNVQGQATRR
jgi:CheY-like chemotaxis protein